MDLATERPAPSAPTKPPKPFADGLRDQRIIDLVVAGDERALRGFSKTSGAPISAVRARAKRLGLTPGFVKECRLAGTHPSMRDCLRCDDRFLSSGRHNRLCRRCGRQT